MMKRALGESNNANGWAGAPALEPSKRTRTAPDAPQPLLSPPQPWGGVWVEVLDGTNGSVRVSRSAARILGPTASLLLMRSGPGSAQSEFALAHAGKLFGQNGNMLEPCRVDGQRQVYRALSLSWDEVFGR